MVHSVSDLIGKFGQSLSSEVRQCDIHGEYKSTLLGCGNSRPAVWTRCDLCLEIERKEKDKIQSEEIAKTIARESLEKKIGRACIPPRFVEKSFENFNADTSVKQVALNTCKEYADNFEKHLKVGRSILMLGDVGTGKTHLASAIGNQILRETKYSVLYITASSIIRYVKNSFNKDSEYSESDAYHYFAKPHLLIIDEVGVQNATEFELTVMFEVINLRYEEMKPTMVISNRGIADLPKYLGDRVVDRLREGGGKMIPFKWESERSKRDD